MTREASGPSLAGHTISDYKCAGCGMPENVTGTTDCECPTRVLCGPDRRTKWKNDEQHGCGPLSLGRDEARLALFQAIEAVKLGNKTDDKLILEELRKLGVWLYRACAWCGRAPIREVLDGEALCQDCCDKWARAQREVA